MKPPIIVNKLGLFIYLFLMLIGLISCSEPDKKPNELALTTKSEAALRYYKLGWEQVMDEGNYSAAEISYRKAVAQDPNFLMGKAVLARLTRDLEERLDLYGEVQEMKSLVHDDERLVLDVYQALVKFTNIREQHPQNAKIALDSTLKLARQNLSVIVSKYPDEVYLKSEYIEILHLLYGAGQTLDSIRKLVDNEQLKNPFLRGYKAVLLAEVDDFETALLEADTLKRILDLNQYPKPNAVFGTIYFKMDSFKKSKVYLDKGYKLDPNNLDISRLKIKVDEKLDKDN